MSALSGIDQALHDLKAKHLGIPLWQLLGGLSRKRLRMYDHLGGGSSNSVYDERRRRCLRREGRPLPRRRLLRGENPRRRPHRPARRAQRPQGSRGADGRRPRGRRRRHGHHGRPARPHNRRHGDRVRSRPRSLPPVLPRGALPARGLARHRPRRPLDPDPDRRRRAARPPPRVPAAAAGAGDRRGATRRLPRRRPHRDPPHRRALRHLRRVDGASQPARTDRHHGQHPPRLRHAQLPDPGGDARRRPLARRGRLRRHPDRRRLRHPE